MKITAIYDNGGKTLDRYTILTNEASSPSSIMALGLSDNPGAYNGFSQWGDLRTGHEDMSFLGEHIKFEDLSERLQHEIVRRVFAHNEVPSPS